MQIPEDHFEVCINFTYRGKACGVTLADAVRGPDAGKQLKHMTKALRQVVKELMKEIDEGATDDN